MCTTSIAAAYVCAHFAQVVITWVVMSTQNVHPANPSTIQSLWAIMSAVALSYDGACIVLCSPSLQPSAFKGTVNGHSIHPWAIPCCHDDAAIPTLDRRHVSHCRPSYHCVRDVVCF
jgi:hypothetical protein